MSRLLWIILFSLLGGVLSVVAAGSFLLFPSRLRERLLPHFVSFAIGALLGAAFLNARKLRYRAPVTATSKPDQASRTGVGTAFHRTAARMTPIARLTISEMGS